MDQEQIESMGLPTRPRKPKERCLPRVRETVEAEAVPAGVVRKRVECELPAEDSERTGLRALGVGLEENTGRTGLGGAPPPQLRGLCEGRQNARRRVASTRLLR